MGHYRKIIQCTCSVEFLNEEGYLSAAYQALLNYTTVNLAFLRNLVVILFRFMLVFLYKNRIKQPLTACLFQYNAFSVVTFYIFPCTDVLSKIMGNYICMEWEATPPPPPLPLLAPWMLLIGGRLRASCCVSMLPFALPLHQVFHQHSAESSN